MATIKKKHDDDAHDEAEPAAGAPKKSGQMPAKIKLLVPYAFFDDKEKLHSWQQHQEVFEPADIALLIEREVPHTVIEG